MSPAPSAKPILVDPVARLNFLRGQGIGSPLRACSLAMVDTAVGIWFNGLWYGYGAADDCVMLLIAQTPRISPQGHFVTRSRSFALTGADVLDLAGSLTDMLVLALRRNGSTGLSAADQAELANWGAASLPATDAQHYIFSSPGRGLYGVYREHLAGGQMRTTIQINDGMLA